MLNNISSFDFSKMSEEEFINNIKDFLRFKDAVKSHARRILREAGKIDQNAHIEEIIFHCDIDNLVAVRVYQNTCRKIYNIPFSEFVRK